MTGPDEETFVHTVEALTVGQLRAALADLPDDMQISAIPAEGPGSGFADWPQVITAVEVTAGPDAVDMLEIALDYPSGTYYRPRR